LKSSIRYSSSVPFTNPYQPTNPNVPPGPPYPVAGVAYKLKSEDNRYVTSITSTSSTDLYLHATSYEPFVFTEYTDDITTRGKFFRISNVAKSKRINPTTEFTVTYSSGNDQLAVWELIRKADQTGFYMLNFAYNNYLSYGTNGYLSMVGDGNAASAPPLTKTLWKLEAI
jgi:hypothetical protein